MCWLQAWLVQVAQIFSLRLVLSPSFSSVFLYSGFIFNEIFPKWWQLSPLVPLGLHFTNFERQQINNTSFPIMPAKSQVGCSGVQLDSQFTEAKGNSPLTDWAQATDHFLKPRENIQLKLHTLRISGRLVAPKKNGVLFPKESSQKPQQIPFQTRI